MIQIQIWISLFIFFILLFDPVKEGFEGEDEDYMKLIIDSLIAARKDGRMRPDQKMAIEDALRYTQYIKTL